MLKIWNRFFRKPLAAKVFAPFHRTELKHSSLYVALWYGNLLLTPEVLHFTSVGKELDMYVIRMGFKTKDGRTIELFYQRQKYQLPGWRAEYVAIEVASAIANQLQSTCEKAMLLGSDSRYWVLIYNSALRILLREGLKNSSLSEKTYQENPDFYNKKYTL